ncbi:sulfite exporter TauE/SafE family protein [Castellaniella sp. WN]
MSLFEISFLITTAFIAGAVNAVAGGGTFFSFPALLAVGVPPVIANASNAVALWPASLSSAWEYRRELALHKGNLAWLSGVSFIGGIGGGLLLLAIQEAVFTSLIPWLLLFATLLFACSQPLKALRTRARGHFKLTSRGTRALSTLAYLLVAIYGGFFGAGMGILLLAALSISGHDDILVLNAFKNLLSAIIYSVAVATFILANKVAWTQTLIMLIAATLGGYIGAVAARRIPQGWLRIGIIFIGFALSAIYFIKTYA